MTDEEKLNALAPIIVAMQGAIHVASQDLPEELRRSLLMSMCLWFFKSLCETKDSKVQCNVTVGILMDMARDFEGTMKKMKDYVGSYENRPWDWRKDGSTMAH